MGKIIQNVFSVIICFKKKLTLVDPIFNQYLPKFYFLKSNDNYDYIFLPFFNIYSKDHYSSSILDH